MAEIKTALVTGAGRRLGRGLAAALAADGWHVVAHYNASAEGAESLVTEIAAAGGRAWAIQADLTDGRATETLIGRAVEVAGPLTCLVNNASLFEVDRLARLTLEGLERHFAVNLRAPTLLCRDYARQLPEGEQGAIVNIQDQALHDGGPAFLSYALCKVGLEVLTQKLAADLAPAIRVNGIAPGYTLPGPKQTTERHEAAYRNSPLGRGGSIEDCAAALRFLLGAPSVTGEVIRVDGGIHLRHGGRGS
ncbi:MAG: SDR family oxidoreductase [Pseudomonadota bacterium]